jgi:hypothetical protein
MAILNYLSMADFRKAIDRVCGAGLQGVFADSHPLKARFRSNYAAKIDLEVDLPAGSTRLRLQCPGTGGIFVGSRAVYRSEDSNADEVRHLCTAVCFLSLSTCSTCSEDVPIEMACRSTMEMQCGEDSQSVSALCHISPRVCCTVCSLSCALLVAYLSL